MICDIQKELDATCAVLGVPRKIVDPNKPYYISHGEWADGEFLFNGELFNAEDVYDMCESENPTGEEIADACRILSDEFRGHSVEESDLSALFFQIPNEESENSEKEKDERYELASFIYNYFERNVNKLPRFANVIFYILSPSTTGVGRTNDSNIPSDMWWNFCKSVENSTNPNTLYTLQEVAQMIKDGYFDF